MMVKKGFILLLLCLLLPGFALAEELARSRFQGSSPPPEAPRGEMVAEAYFEDAVFIGDSLMAGIELHGMFPNSHFAAAVGISPQNAMGKVYDTIRGKVNLAELLSPLEYSKMYVLLGANTIHIMGSQAAAERYAAFLNRFVSAYPDKLIYVMAIPPRITIRGTGRRAPSLERIGNFNHAVRALCGAHGVYFLDIFSAMLLPDGQPNPQYLAGDGMHLSRAGSEMVRDFIMTHTVKEQP